MVSKGRAHRPFLWLSQGGLGGNRNPPRIFLGEREGVFFQFGKNTPSQASDLHRILRPRRNGGRSKAPIPGAKSCRASPAPSPRPQGGTPRSQATGRPRPPTGPSAAGHSLLPQVANRHQTPAKKHPAFRLSAFYGAGCEARARPRHPAKALRGRPFAGALPPLILIAAQARQAEAASSPLQKRNRTSKPDVLLFMERATRLELATSTLARWRSTR